MTDFCVTQFGSNHSVQFFPGESMVSARDRWEASAPNRHCGPIYIR